MIEVRPYDEQWPVAFAAERARLEDALRPWLAGGVEHIGSTSVPGLAAKPMLDMMAGIADLEQARAAVPVLEALDYEQGSHRPHEALWFGKPAGTTQLSGRTHNLHMTQVGSDLWRERLAFRDALRADAALRDEYAALKLRLAQETDDLGDYTARKRELVARVLADAGIVLSR